MCTKLVLFIATLYVVNASVISHDAYDVDGSFGEITVDNEAEESELSLSGALVEEPQGETAEFSSDSTDLSERRRCLPRLCNRLCRSKGLGNGTCIDGRCQCSNQVNELSGDGMTFNDEAEESELNLDDEVEDIEARFAKLSSDLEELSEKRRCFPRVCNRICRLKRLGNGTCIEGRCKCSNKVNESSAADESSDNEFEESKLKFGEEAEDTETDIAKYFLNPTDLSEKRRCFPRLCDIFCRLKRLGNGTCVDGRCECSGRGDQSFVDDLPENLVEQSDLSNNEAEDVAYESNNNAEEPELNSNRVVEDTDTAEAAFYSDPRDLFVKRRCSPRRCDRLCRRKRFAKGTCVRGRCKCEKEVPESTTKRYTTTEETTTSGYYL